MNEMKIIDVFAVYGDYGNIGSGNLIGIFTNEVKALAAAKGRGSLDCGGDGRIEKRLGIKLGEKINLLELGFFVTLDTVVSPDPRYIVESWTIRITSVKKPIDFMVVYRRRTGCALKDAKAFMNLARSDGGATLDITPTNLMACYSKEEALEWKQELEMNGIATVDIE